MQSRDALPSGVRFRTFALAPRRRTRYAVFAGRVDWTPAVAALLTARQRTSTNAPHWEVHSPSHSPEGLGGGCDGRLVASGEPVLVSGARDLARLVAFHQPAGCGPGGRGFESRRSPLKKHLQIGHFQAVTACGVRTTGVQLGSNFYLDLNSVSPDVCPSHRSTSPLRARWPVDCASLERSERPDHRS